MPRTVSIAACQFVVRPIASFDEFAAHARGLLDRAEGADLVLFPELFTIELFTTFPDWMDLPASELTRIHAIREHPLHRRLSPAVRERGQGAGAAHRRRLSSGEEGRQVSQRRLPLRPRRAGSHPRQDAYLPGRSRVAHRGRRYHRDGRASLRQGRVQRVLRGRDSRVRREPRGAGRRDHPLPLVHLHGARLLARPPLRPGARGREPGLRRALRRQRRALPPGGPLPSPWGRSAILSPCDTPVGCAERRRRRRRPAPNIETVVRGVVDLDRLHENRENGAAPTFRDRRRRADLYGAWPGHFNA